MANIALIDGWNETSVSGVELYAEDGAAKRVRWLESDEVSADHEAIAHELARYGLRAQLELAEAGEADHECIAPVEVAS